jgi:hypothetical protein
MATGSDSAEKRKTWKRFKEKGQKEDKQKLRKRSEQWLSQSEPQVIKRTNACNRRILWLAASSPGAVRHGPSAQIFTGGVQPVLKIIQISGIRYYCFSSLILI